MGETPKKPEKRDPDFLETCGSEGIKIFFNGWYIWTVGTKQNILFLAVAGNLEGDSTYSGQRQKIEGGPLPAGRYWIQPSDFGGRRKGLDLLSSKTSIMRELDSLSRHFNGFDGWGNKWVTIHPYPDTEMYGRGGFFIHGGDVYGSNGCIDLAHNVDAFFEALNQELGNRQNCHIPLYVEYDNLKMRIRNPLKNMQLRTHQGGRFAPQTNDFGMVRNEGTRAHQGWDLKAPVGTPVYAISDGEIVSIRTSIDYGSTLTLKFTYRGQIRYAFYAHLSLLKVVKLRTVEMGELIAYTGKTGNASNLADNEAHLHFEIRIMQTVGKGLFGRINPAEILGSISNELSELS